MSVCRTENGFTLGFYELFKDGLTPEGGNVNNLAAWRVFTAAGAAGFLFWFLTYPTDVIKSTMQSDELEKSQRKFSGIVDCARKLYINEGGIKRFFKGFTPCLLRAIPANATMLYVLEKTRQFLDPYF